MNVPAASDDMTTSTSSPAEDANIPITTPNGVAIEKTKTSYRTRRKSFGNVFTRLIPSALAAAPLCITIASTLFKVLIIDDYKPSAIPSKHA